MTSQKNKEKRDDFPLSSSLTAFAVGANAQENCKTFTPEEREMADLSTWAAIGAGVSSLRFTGA